MNQSTGGSGNGSAGQWLDVRVDEKQAKFLNALLRLDRASHTRRRGPEWTMAGKPVVVVFRRRDGAPVYRCEPRNQSEVNRIYFDLRKRLGSMGLADFCSAVGIEPEHVLA